MSELKLAYRNVFRHLRRSVATLAAVALACAGLVLFGGYIVWVHLEGETHAVIMVGHLQISKRGYAEKGAGDPAAFALDDYDALRRLLRDDPEIGPRSAVITGQLVFGGLIHSPTQRKTAPFLGVGWEPADFDRLMHWNAYGLSDMRDLAVNRPLFAVGPELDAAQPDAGTLGIGLSRILGIAPGPAGASDGGRGAMPVVRLFAMTPTGIRTGSRELRVRGSVPRGLKELDDRYVFVPLELASDIVFPAEPTRVTSILVQLHDSADQDRILGRIRNLIAERRLDLEVRSWQELLPLHVQTRAMIDMFFVFSLAVVSVVLVFLVYITMMMSVVERTREIGTIRAMGATRRRVLAVFLLEGLMLGAVGGALGIGLGSLAAAVINAAEILYQPPTIPFMAKLEILVAQDLRFPLAAFCACLAVTLVASYFPARSASRLVIADALRR